MNRNTYFNSPLLLGFDHLERLLERTAKSANDGYPPYNIEQTGPDCLRITLAVAGFSRDELDVTVEDNQLVIRGRQTESADKTFLHRGIAARQFQRAFVLADGIEVTGAELTNGLLSINLARPQPETVSRKIDIREASANPEGRAEGDRQ
jgi:HSP20 family molecular chaperone IbpA